MHILTVERYVTFGLGAVAIVAIGAILAYARRREPLPSGLQRIELVWTAVPVVILLLLLLATLLREPRG